MSRNRGGTDSSFNALVRAANPFGTRAAAALALEDAQHDLCEALLLQPLPAPTAAPRPHGRRGVRVQRIAASLGVVVVGAIVALSVGGVFAGRSATAWGAELVRFAEASPLVLLDQAGWQVVYANEGSAQDGEMRFRSGPAGAANTAPVSATAPTLADTSAASLDWRPGPLSAWMADRANSANLTTTAPVLGTVAHVYQYAGGQPGHQDITALWDYGGRVLEFRAGAADVTAFKSLLASLRQVDANTWLSALPDSVVKTTARRAVIASMLQGVTLPPGFDPSAITGAGLTSDRYQLGAAVAGTVACTWFKRWSDARSTGNSAGVEQAIAAMATATDWPILQEMAKSGAYPQVLESLVAAMPGGLHGGRPLAGDVDSALGCSQLGVPLGQANAAGGPTPAS